MKTKVKTITVLLWKRRISIAAIKYREYFKYRLLIKKFLKTKIVII